VSILETFLRYLPTKITFASSMIKTILITLVIGLITNLSFSQIITTPAVEWSEPFYGGSRGGAISTVIGPNVLFVAAKAQNSISGIESISKFDANGRIKTQNIVTEGGSSNAPTITQYACQDGGILVYSFINRWIRKYDGNLNLSWQQTISYTLINATATLANGFYVYAQSTINSKNVIEVIKLQSDGSVEWSIDITSFTSNITDIQTTSDDGVIVGTNNGLRKYSSSGQLLWNNLSIVNATTFVPLDASTMYIRTQNSSLNNTLNIMQINTQNGSTIWTKSFNSEIINSFAIIRDKGWDNGCAIMTNTGLYKFNTSGVQEWKNTQYTSSPIVATGDGGILIIQNNQLVKLTMGNVFNWNKTFDSSFSINIANAPDNGIYVIAQRKSYRDTSEPLSFVFKIASPDTPCKMDFDITGSDATFCSSGNLTLGYKIGNTNNTMNSPFVEFGFQWNKNNSNILSANSSAYIAQSTGKYTLAFTQGTCQNTSRSVEMKISSAPVIGAEEVFVCQGQTANIFSTGCEGTVVWSNGERGSNLKLTLQTTSTYNAYCETIIINENGVSELCKTVLSNTIMISVHPFSNLKIEEIKGKKEFCETGSTTLEVVTSGGIQSFIFRWQKDNVPAVVSPNGLIKINEEGNYQLLLTDGVGCSVSSEIISVKKVLNPVTPNVSAQGLTEICSGSNVTLMTDAKEVSYQWLKNEIQIKDATGQSYKVESSGTYKIQVVNTSGCMTTSDRSITITEIVVSQPFIKQSNDSLISSYLNENKWFLNGSQLNENGYKIKFTTTGNYQVKAVFKGCESEPSSVFKPIILANENSIADVSLYPNPVSNNLVISSSQLVKYKFFDILGRVIKEEHQYKTEFFIDVLSLNDGEYLLLLQGINQNEYFRKIVIRK
jgi:Secretion system C-terminal sorting domain/PQQ-like domain